MYFVQLSGAARNWKLVETLFSEKCLKRTKKVENSLKKCSNQLSGVHSTKSGRNTQHKFVWYSGHALYNSLKCPVFRESENWALKFDYLEVHISDPACIDTREFRFKDPIKAVRFCMLAKLGRISRHELLCVKTCVWIGVK